MNKTLEWIASILRAWLGSDKTGQIEIHFNQGEVTRIIQSTASRPPQ